MSKQDLINAIQTMRKTYGDDVVKTLQNQSFNVIPTGVPQLETILGTNGVVRGKMLELSGMESSGKSLLCATISANAAKAGFTVLYVDYEASLVADFLRRIGVPLGTNFLVIEALTMEEGFEKSLPLLKTGEINLVIYDSVGAMTPKQRIGREAGNPTPGDLSKALSACLSVLHPVLQEFNIAAIFTNHIRMTGFQTGQRTREIEAGGNALRFYLHQKVRLQKLGLLKSGPNTIGQEVSLRCIKNKLARPFLETKLKMMFDVGIDKFGYAIEVLEQMKIISVGSTGWVQSDELGIKIRGKDNFLDAIKASTELTQRVLDLVATNTQNGAGITEEEIGEDE